MAKLLYFQAPDSVDTVLVFVPDEWVYDETSSVIEDTCFALDCEPDDLERDEFDIIDYGSLPPKYRIFVG
jgi:hypothetical protein